MMDANTTLDADSGRRAGEERLRLAKEAADLGIFDYDPDAGLVHVDARTRELWGLGADDALTMDEFLAAIHPEDRAEAESAMTAATSSGRGGRFHSQFRLAAHRTGRPSVIAAMGQAYFRGGRAVRLVGIVQDVSEKIHLEAEIQERRGAMDRLAKHEIVAHTAAAIAHDLNQPLVAISAYAEVAQRALQGGTMDEQALLHALNGCVEQAQRAGKKLSELLDFLHDGDIESAPIHLNEVIREAIDIAKLDGYGGFRAELKLEPYLPPVLGNRLQVQKVLINLFHNSLDAMRECGVSPAAISIAVSSVAGHYMAQVTVCDNGPGFAPDTVLRAFEPFFTTKPHGIGLGLAISRALIEAHGGQLWIDPGRGPGATFHFTLPFADVRS